MSNSNSRPNSISGSRPNLSLTSSPISSEERATKALKSSLVFCTEEKIVNFDNGFVWVHDGENCMSFIFFFLRKY